MALELLSVVVGAVVGGVVVAGLVEAMGRTRGRPVAADKLTSAWRISELGRPIIMARDVADVDVPAGARIVASGFVDPVVFSACDVRQVPDVRVEAAVDGAGGRAMLFLAGMRRGAMAIVTTAPDTVGRLAAEAEAAWDRADPYVERLGIGDLAGRAGMRVETRGTVQEVLPHREGHLIRLADRADVIGVVVPKDPAELRGVEVRVRGRLERDASGFSVIQADDVRRLV